MLTDFLNNTCNIIEKVKTIVGGEEIITSNTIYNGIKCHYYSGGGNTNDTDSALNTDLSVYKVIVEPNKTNIKKEMIINIFDNDLGNIGSFIIEEVKMNRLINGTNDSIELKVKAIG